MRKGRRAGVLLLALAVLLVATAPAGAAIARAAATSVSVTLDEFSIKLSKGSVPKGTINFSVKNAGSISHDFKIVGKKTALLKGGKSGKLTVTITKAGRYTAICTVAGHAAAGMKVKLRVR